MDQPPTEGAGVVDQPEPGFFKLRLTPKGWYEVPARIILDANDGGWSAEIDGESAGPAHPDPVLAPGVLTIWHTRKVPITEAEYRFLCGPLKDWARAYYPEHPCLSPREPVDPRRLRPIPQFHAPQAPTALSDEPLPENRPPAPHLPSAEEIIAWLEYEHEALARAIERDVATLLLDQTTIIEDEAGLARISANVDIARARYRTAKQALKTAKAPFVEAGTAIDDWFRHWTDAISRAVEPLRTAMDAYATRVEAERRKQKEAEARQRREEAERIAAEAARTLTKRPHSVEADVKLGAAALAADLADRAEREAAARPADFTRTRTAYGRAVSAREVWDFEIADLAALPREKMLPNLQMIAQDVRAFARAQPEQARAGVAPYGGIRIVRRLSMLPR